MSRSRHIRLGNTHITYRGWFLVLLVASLPRGLDWSGFLSRQVSATARRGKGRTRATPDHAASCLRSLVVLDFDLTITRKHMWEAYDEAPLEDIPVDDSTFVDITALRTLVSEVREHGHEVAIATFGRRDVARKAMCYAFGGKNTIYISTPADIIGARASFRQASLLGDKNIQLDALAKKFNFTRPQIVLLDDQARNIQKAVQHGCKGMHVPRGLTRDVVGEVMTALLEGAGDCFVNFPEDSDDTPSAWRFPKRWLTAFRRRAGKQSPLQQVDRQSWVTALPHSYKSLLEDNSHVVGVGRHARVLRVVRKCPVNFFDRFFERPCDAVEKMSHSYAWKMYVATVEALLDGMYLDERRDAIEPDVGPRYKRLLKLSKRGLLPHCMMPLDAKPRIEVLEPLAVADDDTPLRIRKFRMGLIFPLMDGDASVFLKKEPSVAIQRSFGKFMLVALVALRKSGYVHCDIKLENILYKGQENPEWWLSDFDFVTPVLGPAPHTPPMLNLIEEGLRKSLQEPVTGVEDFQSFVQIYAQLDPSTTAEEKQAAFDFIAQDASAMGSLAPESFPRLGVFDPASIQW
eukprot:TRINITY_DN33345_c0_g1_i1.p1 TRINITY_DN33345_c0_g1~~TRINITY_DN33345_c0_g1_i1.p1  ORF type:complete len:574 (+),score=82.69 TRINITY_DN33345_c0_g1_i1:55-1776(+)